jgi:hypothetical protein
MKMNFNLKCHHHMIDLNHSRNLAVRQHVGCFNVLFLPAVLIAGFGLVMLTG